MARVPWGALATSAVLLGVAAGAARCGGGSKPPEPPPGAGQAGEAVAEKPEPGGTLIVAHPSDGESFLAPVIQNAQNSEIADHILPSVYHASFEGGLKYHPRLAEKWAWDPSHTTLTIHFRKDAKWTDGQPFTADDYLETYEILKDPKSASPRSDHVQHFAEGGVRKLDAHTVSVTFTHAYDEATMLAHSALNALVPAHRLKGVDRGTLRGLDIAREPVSTGPFKLARWEKGQMMVLERNPEVKELPVPHLDRVIFKVVPEYTSRLVELENGSVHMVASLQVEDYQRLKESHPELKFYRRGYRTMDYVAWNLRDPRFSDLRVRKALGLAIDVDQIMASLLTAGGESFGRRAVGTVTPALADAYASDVKPIPYDPDKARSLLAEAGWKDTDGDGVVDKDGKPLRFKVEYNTGNPRRAKAVIFIQDQLKKVGVRIDPTEIESNTFFENMRQRNFEAALGGWSAALFLDMTGMWACESETEKHQFNFTGYCDPETDRLMDAALKEVDPLKAGALWKQVQARIYEAQPYTFLYWREDVDAVHGKVRNVQSNILSPTYNLHEWWIPKALQGP